MPKIIITNSRGREVQIKEANMPIREKVILAVKTCSPFFWPCENEQCPYYENVTCIETLRNDIIALLNPKEADDAE